jgi:4-phytase / acid phosphatase
MRSVFLFLLCGFCPALSLLPQYSFAQDTATNDRDSDLRAVVILTRHGVRAPLSSEIRGSLYNAQPWPEWSVPSGVLTEHGTAALRLMGAWYRARYGCQPHTVYAEANGAQRTIASAKALIEGLGVGCEANVTTSPAGQANPLFGPAFAAEADPAKLANAILGRLGAHPDWWTRAFRESLEEMRHVLLDCTGTDCDHTKKSLLTAPALVAPVTRGLVNVDGPVAMGADFAEHFLLQYTEGLPMENVGWGRVSRPLLDRFMEMNTRYHDFVLRTTYYAQIAASDLAWRIAATMRQAASGKETTGALGGTRNRIVILAGHDSNLTWLGGLLRLDWLLPDETFNATPPGSGLVFELRRDRTTGEFRVSALFVSQTLDQIRYLKPLTGVEQPALVPVFIPGCSGRDPDYSCPVEDFSRVVEAAVDPRFVEPRFRGQSGLREPRAR